MKSFTLADILTPSEIERAKELYREYGNHATHARTFNALVSAEIVLPNMPRINKALGQENDPRYIGYAIEYCLMRERETKAGPRRDKKWK